MENSELTIKKGYKQTDVGIIPEDWKTLTLGEIGEIRGRVGWKGYTKDDLRSSGFYTIGAKHIDENNKLDLTDPTYLCAEKYYESPEIMVEQNDILIVQRGTIGKLVFIDKQIGEATINPSMLIFRTKSVSSPYIFYILTSATGQNQILLDTTSTGVPMITQRQVGNFAIPLPPLPEQQAIAEVLSDVDALITSLDQLITKKRNIKQGTMQLLLTGKKRLPNFSGDWQTKKLGDCCERITTGKLDANAMVENGEFRFYTCAKEYYFINNFAFDCESLLVSGNGANVGYIHYYKGKFNAYQRTYVLMDFNENIQFIKIFMDKYLKNRIETEVNSGNTPYIKMDTLTEMEIKLPPTKEEQKAIAQILSEMDAEIEALETQRDKYKAVKQGMMQELLTGKTRLLKK